MIEYTTFSEDVTSFSIIVHDCNLDLTMFRTVLTSPDNRLRVQVSSITINSFLTHQSTDQPSHIIKTTGATVQHGMNRNLVFRNRKLRNQSCFRTRKLRDVTSDGYIWLIDNEENTQRSRLDVDFIFAVG